MAKGKNDWVTQGQFKEAMDRIDGRFEKMEAKFDSALQRLGVMIEHLEYKFDLALEGFGVLNVRTVDLERRVDILEKKEE